MEAMSKRSESMEEQFSPFLVHTTGRPKRLNTLARVGGIVSSWIRPIWIWTLLFVFVVAILILFSSDPLAGLEVIHIAAIFLFCFSFFDLIQNGGHINSLKPIQARWWYLLIMSGFALWKPSFYVATFYYFKQSPTVEDILHELQYRETTIVSDVNRSPMQALSFGNDYARRLGEALNIHFDRYERNETERFGYVKQLNLIGNLFDDDGVEAVADALDHPFSYTDSLLLGRNTYIGDKAAIRFATLIESSTRKAKSHTYPNVAGEELTWLEFGGTAVTNLGLSELYRSLGTRPFSYLGLEYTRFQRGIFAFFPFLNFGASGLFTRSFQYLHEATYLQELSLTGIKLGDDDISIVAEGVSQTNITTLTLFNNKIGSSGVEHLVPLVTQLTELTLSMNRRIGDDGAAILVQALKHPNSTLETLFLTNCNIGQKGAEALLSIFPGNTRLKLLHLTSKNNGIDKETLEALERATKANWK